MTVTEKAFAKINLCLDIVSRRANGYHNLESVMHTIPLFDTVTITKSKEISITCSNPAVPADSSNLAYKAAVKFFEKTKIKDGASIHIEKRIPMAAGMAGGSADCAATLRGLNRLYGFPLENRELEELGGSLGADVPFCIRSGTFGVTGIGHDFFPVSAPPKFIYVIACGSEGISTPAMYKEYDERYNPPLCDEPKNLFTQKSENLRIALEKGEKEEIFSSMFNCFEEIAEEQRPEIKKIKSIMMENGAAFSMMSGSGPSVFGIFEDAEKAYASKNAIENEGIFATVVSSNNE